MTIAERLMLSKDEKVCCNCKYFRQHYIYTSTYKGMDYMPCNSGHCVEARLKHRKAKQKACERFQKKGESQ